MDFFSAMKIAAGGLSVQRTRMNVISSNLANAETTRTAEGGPYRRLDVVVRAKPVATTFAQSLDEAMGTRTAEVDRIVKDTAPPRLVFDPSHPDANPEGYVAMPNVNTVHEMVNMVTATRAYDANVTLLKTIRTMVDQALAISR